MGALGRLGRPARSGPLSRHLDCVLIVAPNTTVEGIRRTALQSFADAGVRPHTVAALAALGVTEPVLVLAQAIPLILEEPDVGIQAPTWSGQTRAFLVSMIEKLPRPRGCPCALDRT